jgi:hypothetical protein
MAEIVNLRLARKRAKRQADEERAAAQRLAHGVNKADRVLGKARADKARGDLEAHKLSDGETE